MAEPTIQDIDSAIAARSAPSMGDIDKAIALRSQGFDSMPNSNAKEKEGGLTSVINRIRSGKPDTDDIGESAANYAYTHPGQTGAMVATSLFPPAEMIGPLAKGAQAAQIFSRAGKIGAATAGIAGAGAAVGRTAHDVDQGLPASDIASNAADDALTQGAIFGTTAGLASAAAPYAAKAANYVMKTSAGKASADAIKAAAQRLGFTATPGMVSGSPVVQQAESSLSQSPSIAGSWVKKTIKPMQTALQNAAEDLVSGEPGIEASTYEAGSSAAKGVAANLGEKVSNVKMAYEPFNDEFPKMIPELEDKALLTQKIVKIGEEHLDPNEVTGIVNGTTNKIVGSNNLEDIENVRKTLGQHVTKALRAGDTERAETLSKMKDALSDFRDSQFQKLAQQSHPGPGGAAAGKQMVSEYKSAMAQHADLMKDLRDVGPLFGIKAKNPRDFIEAFNEIPPEQMAKTLFQSNNYNAVQKVREYFPEEFETIKNLKLQELRSKSLANPIDPNNSPVDPMKLVSNINKFTRGRPEIRELLLGDKAQKLSDMQTVLGSLPEKVGPSGTKQAFDSSHMADPWQQGRDLLNYGVYRGMGSNLGSKVVPKILPQIIENSPRAAGPAATVIQMPFSQGLESALPAAAAGDPNTASQKPQQNGRGPSGLPFISPSPTPTPTPSGNGPIDTKGPNKWANDGFQKLKGHVSDEDRKMLEENKGAMLLDPKAKQLLITASNYSPGSKPLDDIMKHLKNRLDRSSK